MPILICQQCGRMFEVTPSREHSARYCSKECQIAATQKKRPSANAAERSSIPSTARTRVFAPASVPAQRKAA